MRYGAAIALASIVFATSCGPSGLELAVDLRTDFRPTVDFVDVRTVLVGGDGAAAREVERTLSVRDDALRGIRVAELAGLTSGSWTIRVQLLDAGGAIVASRSTTITISRDTAIAVVVTRACATSGLACPGASDSPLATECVAGRCVEPTCHPGALARCGMLECSNDADCAGGADCVAAVCAGGFCLRSPRDALCGDGERCDAAMGCVPDGVTEDGGVDAGPVDGGAPDGSVVWMGNVCGPDIVTPYGGSVRCARPTGECIIGCGGSGDPTCVDSCVAMDPNPTQCLACLETNEQVCVNESGCQGEWDVLQCCIEHGCGGMLCTACDPEGAVWRTCADAELEPLCTHLLACFPA